MCHGWTGAAVMCEKTGCKGRPYYLKNNKDVYDSEVYAIFRALKTID